MRFAELTCDSLSFHSIRFNTEGLSLIVGDGPKDRAQEGSSNGVGKTLSLELAHHCLGAKVDMRLKKATPDWLFTLAFHTRDGDHVIARSGDGKKTWLDGKHVSMQELRRWLDESGAFYMDPGIPALSFRSLFKRFARYAREDCLDPLRTRKETDFEGLLRSSYLLGLDCSLEVSKKQHKVQLDDLDLSERNWQHDNILKEVFRAGAQPRLRAEWLERELPRLRADLRKFQVAENYRAIEREVGDLTEQLRGLDRSVAVLEFQTRSIERSLELHPDISRDDLLELYSGIENIFKPEILEHFDAVQQFHDSLAATRKERFTRDLSKISAELYRLEEERKGVANRRDALLQSLQGKRALDEYSALAQQIARLDEERNRLLEFLNFSANLRQRAQSIRERRVEEDRAATEYISTQPLSKADEYFASLAQMLYPRSPAGIVIDNNVGDNQIRFNIAVQIEGDSSDGINDARILCFDWLTFMKGANHTIDVLWHDNRLFADIDPKVRAAWFSHVLRSLPGTGKQYIASLNTENYKAMLEFLTPVERGALEKATVLVLRGDAPENKLLGFQFGK